VFQKITEVFHLEHLIGTTPQGTLFQLAFCLLIYNVIQVVRGYVAVAGEREAETISVELLFDDVQRQLVALHEVLAVEEVVELFPVVPTAAEVQKRLTKLLSGVDRSLAEGAEPETATAAQEKQGTTYVGVPVVESAPAATN
jgi:hypothetical protein